MEKEKNFSEDTDKELEDLKRRLEALPLTAKQKSEQIEEFLRERRMVAESVQCNAEMDAKLKKRRQDMLAGLHGALDEKQREDAQRGLNILDEFDALRQRYGKK